MALAATHIKFALDVKGKYHVQDMGRYLIGTIYPDSRYITGIKRELTHGDYLLSSQFASDDFKKGWSVHFVCDKVFNKITDKDFSEFLISGAPANFGTDWWINKTAIKILLDIEILKKIDIKQYLPMLNLVENPNGESIEDMRYSNSLTQKLYIKEKVTIEDIGIMFLKLGIKKELIKGVVRKSTEYSTMPDFSIRINNLYESMLALAAKINL